MINVNPAPPQNTNSSLMPNVQSPIVNNSPSTTKSITKEEPDINKNKSSANGSNKLWIILLMFLAMIIGFWIGYFTQGYFNNNQNNLIGRVNQPTPTIQPTVEPIIQPTATPSAVNKEYVVFRVEESYLNDGLNFASQEQCVEDEIAKLIAIEDDYITIQINQWSLEEDTGEYLPELIDFQVQDQECLAVRPICPDVFIERCFSLENIDGVYYLDYEFGEEGVMPQVPDLQSEL